MPGRHSKSFTTTSSRQGDVQKNKCLPFCLCRDAGAFGGDEWAVSSFGHKCSKNISASRAILESWEANGASSEDRVLHVIVWRCRDRDFPLNYSDRLQRIMLHIQDFYRKEMVRHGLGQRSFNLDVQPSGNLVIHEVVGQGDWRDYQKSDGQRIKQECAIVLREKGVRVDQETIMIFTNLAELRMLRRECFRIKVHTMPVEIGLQGVAWQLDSEELDVLNLSRKMPMITDGEYGRISLGKHNSNFHWWHGSRAWACTRSATLSRECR